MNRSPSGDPDWPAAAGECQWSVAGVRLVNGGPMRGRGYVIRWWRSINNLWSDGGFMSYPWEIMELTSYYDSVFYISSSGERNVYQDPGYHQHSAYEAKYEPQSPMYQSPSIIDYSLTSPGDPQSPSGVSPSSSYSPSSPSCSPSTSGYITSNSPFNFTELSKHSDSLNSGSKLPKIPPIEILQQRRLAANARERKRANKINFAFNRLRKVLPGFSDREISKFEAIQLARDYIAQLSTMLEEDGPEACVRIVSNNSNVRQGDKRNWTK